jgi:hypothetical protein
LARGGRKWSLHGGQIPNARVVREHVSTGYSRVEGNRRASRNGCVSDLPPECYDSQLLHRCSWATSHFLSHWWHTPASLTLSRALSLLRDVRGGGTATAGKGPWGAGEGAVAKRPTARLLTAMADIVAGVETLKALIREQPDSLASSQPSPCDADTHEPSQGTGPELSVARGARIFCRCGHPPRARHRAPRPQARQHPFDRRSSGQNLGTSPLLIAEGCGKASPLLIPRVMVRRSPLLIARNS